MNNINSAGFSLFRDVTKYFALCHWPQSHRTRGRFYFADRIAFICRATKFEETNGDQVSVRRAPVDWPREAEEKSDQNEKLSERSEFFSFRFFLSIAGSEPAPAKAGDNRRGPIGRIFDRYAMKAARTLLRISGLRINLRAKQATTLVISHQTLRLFVTR